MLVNYKLINQLKDKLNTVNLFEGNIIIENLKVQDIKNFLFNDW